MNIYKFIKLDKITTEISSVVIMMLFFQSDFLPKTAMHKLTINQIIPAGAHMAAKANQYAASAFLMFLL